MVNRLLLVVVASMSCGEMNVCIEANLFKMFLYFEHCHTTLGPRSERAMGMAGGWDWDGGGREIVDGYRESGAVAVT